ncbi:carbohydrate ABC transporter permease [Rhodococcus gannanensis]|jgi:ABC-type sugar transport system permease subunit|uniref:Carbohydrate ABC transporter permease n=1 Tax=Rhodococcus gannanensis TaxID=1960308 RepID=A0ABW4P456_9NOCA
MTDSAEPGGYDNDAVTEVIHLGRGVVAPDAPDAPPPPPRRRFDWRPVYLIAPTILVLAVIIVYPVVKAVMMSFQRNPGFNEDTGRFVTGGFAGFDNYLLWLTGNCGDGRGTCPPGTLGADFWPAVGVTLLFTVAIVGFSTLLGLWMATIMGRSFVGRSFLRASVLIPWAIPTAVTAKLWYFIFAENGIANSLLGTDIAWMTDPWASRLAVIIADVWKTTPFMALLILAGLQMIPQDVYEAARVDGASAWQRFKSITLPLVKPALMVAVLFRTLDVLRIYDLPAILGGTSGSTPISTVAILTVADIRQGHLQSASALSTLIFLGIFAVAFVMVKFLGANAVRTQDEQRKGGDR